MQPAVADTDEATAEAAADELDALDAGNPETEIEGQPETDPDGDGPNVAEVQLTDDDFSGGSGELFDEVEDASKSADADDQDDSDDESDEADGDEEEALLDGLDGKSAQLEEAINDGAARLAVVGIDDESEKDDLEDEFSEVFDAFRLGYFGSQVFEEYMAPEGEDVAPEWGLLGAILCASAFVLWMRPDGEEQITRLKDAVENLIGGDL